MKRNLKILFINTVCGVGSTGRICTDLADALTKQGHECKIAYGRGSLPDRYKIYAVRIGNNLSVNLHAIKTRIFDRTGFGSVGATKKFITWVKEFDPDIIHLHNLHGYYINIEILFDYLKTCGKKVIWTLHDCWAFTGHCAHFAYAKCDKWQVGCNHCAEKKAYPKSAFLDRSKRNYEDKKHIFCNVPNMTIVTPSTWLADLVKQSYLKEYPVEVIYNGIDTDIFKPTQSDFREKYNLVNKKIILGVANVWNERKGFGDFIALSEKLDERTVIVLVGVTDKQIKSLPNKIIGINRTNSIKELASIYTAADVFMNLTYEDTYPTVNLEAQACGTPVITYATGGSVESVPRENVVTIGDIDGLKYKISNDEIEVKNDLPLNSMIGNYISIIEGPAHD